MNSPVIRNATPEEVRGSGVAIRIGDHVRYSGGPRRYQAFLGDGVVLSVKAVSKRPIEVAFDGLLAGNAGPIQRHRRSLWYSAKKLSVQSLADDQDLRKDSQGVE